MRITIAFDRKEEVEKMVARFEKKAARYGADFSVSYGAPYAIKRTYKFEGRTVSTEMVEVFDVEISSDVIKAGEFRAIAKIEHGINGKNIVKVFGCDDVAKDAWFCADPTCEHCGKTRSRNITFIVRKNDGTEYQVGKSCLKDYTGINPEWAIACKEFEDSIDMMDIDNEYCDREFRSHPFVMSTVDALAMAIKVKREQGYVASCENNGNKWVMMEKVKAGEFASDTEIKEAERMAAEIAETDFSGDSLMQNVRSLIANGYCKMENFGYIAYAPVAWGKYEAKKAAADAEAIASNYVGTVGERMTIDVSNATLVTYFATMFGFTYLYKFVDKIGNVFVWFSSVGIDGIEKVKTVKGTVKEHNERDGVRQTVLTRCKVA